MFNTCHMVEQNKSGCASEKADKTGMEIGAIPAESANASTQIPPSTPIASSSATSTPSTAASSKPNKTLVPLVKLETQRSTLHALSQGAAQLKSPKPKAVVVAMPSGDHVKVLLPTSKSVPVSASSSPTPMTPPPTAKIQRTVTLPTNASPCDYSDILSGKVPLKSAPISPKGTVATAMKAPPKARPPPKKPQPPQHPPGVSKTIKTHKTSQMTQEEFDQLDTVGSFAMASKGSKGRRDHPDRDDRHDRRRDRGGRDNPKRHHDQVPKFCDRFIVGRCRHGDSCWYAHYTPEQIAAQFGARGSSDPEEIAINVEEF